MFRQSVFVVLLPVLMMGCSEPVVDVPANPELVSAPYLPDSGTMFVQCGTLIDGRSDQVLNDARVLIEDGIFKSIATDLEVPPGIGVLDLSEYTCLPGLIDMHTHMLESLKSWLI